MRSKAELGPDTSFQTLAEFYKQSEYAVYPQQHRSGGSYSANLMQVEQEAVDMVDAPVPEYGFALLMSNVSTLEVDIGDGLLRYRDVQRGSLNVVPPRTEVRFVVPSSHTIRVLSIPAKTLDPILLEARLPSDAFSNHYFTGKEFTPQPSIDALMNQLWRVSLGSSPSDDLYFDGLVLQFVAELTQSRTLSPLGEERPEDIRIARAIEYIEAHLGRSLTVAEVASVACLSPAHFSRSFKAHTGEPVWTFVQRRRSERAMEMIQHSSHTIADIAYQCGFSNQGHMTTCLKRRFGITPSALRAELRASSRQRTRRRK
ncbi:AraC family transcriptional regulator [Roseibium sp. HPY-6]|uniref:AraC family transcriptional regulator n=1 Tax=Roseibium sp. HPY-6 TaxID=3229852 RepID=UPI0033900DEF